MSSGSGHCVGIVVESRFGASVAPDGNDWGRPNWNRDAEEGHGLEDMWIISEGFFADVQVAFDVSFNYSAGV
jgi:hypothetical protein